ncbi:hypothetical protein PG987_006431 [Apiospora arundinis]
MFASAKPATVQQASMVERVTAQFMRAVAFEVQSTGLNGQGVHGTAQDVDACSSLFKRTTALVGGVDVVPQLTGLDGQEDHGAVQGCKLEEAEIKKLSQHKSKENDRQDTYLCSGGRLAAGKNQH